jgi:hypothetical protein
MKKSLTWPEVRAILQDNLPHDFAIALNYGLYSKKTITLLKSGTYKVENHIDETQNILTSQEIQEDEYTNINKAINRNAFFEL